MEFDSPEEKEFPGLYAAEAADSKSKKSKEESDFDEDHEHNKMDLLIGKRKDKKDKGKDRGYAALEGESSPEEELETKSPSKSKKSKTFKFVSSKSKEKREKSRDKEKSVEEPAHKAKDTDKDKDKERERHDEKELKKKDKKKDKKDKKSKQLSQQQDEDAEEEDLAMGYPVFGVSVSLATERSRCHDGTDLPMVVRDCIDYLQEQTRNFLIYKVEPLRAELLHLKRLYNHREHDAAMALFTVPLACSLLKLFLRDLPEPMLTTDLMYDFEDVARNRRGKEQRIGLQQLMEQVPKCNRTLVGWVMLHLYAVTDQERYNKLNHESIAVLLSPTLQMSVPLMVALLRHCRTIFADIQLIQYVPPLTAASQLPEDPEDIQMELRKQDSLLTQIHSEMNAGFITKNREEQLWEVQRIITQLKRKLRSFEKKQEKSIEELDVSSTQPVPAPPVAVPVCEDTTDASQPPAAPTSEVTNAEEHKSGRRASSSSPVTHSIDVSDCIQVHRNEEEEPSSHSPPLYTVDGEFGFVLLPESNPHREELLRLQIEYDELVALQNELKARIKTERNEVYRLNRLCEQQLLKHQSAAGSQPPKEAEYERIIEHYKRENALLEHKKQMLGKELKEERRACISLQVELRLQQF
ncbi:ralA-binding protein 1 [Drosophila guanche]|uniref:Blast:RalA-binding protein 1 n=1 Tax=Drosophila guanche TaxID=7266 RepID=A0A3B0KJB0_DROGU|nr:ralA-binding protein 1 [Drosophila guanche]SPP83848.1 blast:RalA-binding protein 1 [Drosophila guanche]